MIKPVLLELRTSVFYLGLWLSTFWFGTTGIIFFSFLPYQIRSGYIQLWNRFIVFWGKLICGVRFQVIGAENIPDTPYVALAKHQSQWETIFLHYYLSPVSIVMKRELLRLPFFGWGLRLTKPIAIDRSNPKQALKQIQKKGKTRLAEHISVLIFPEGTRTKPGNKGKYARGGANIAVAGNVPVLPVAHNAGEFWPGDQRLKYPGTITIKFGEPISPSKFSSREITEHVATWIEDEVSKMDKRI